MARKCWRGTLSEIRRRVRVAGGQGDSCYLLHSTTAGLRLFSLDAQRPCLEAQLLLCFLDSQFHLLVGLLLDLVAASLQTLRGVRIVSKAVSSVKEDSPATNAHDGGLVA